MVSGLVLMLAAMAHAAVLPAPQSVVAGNGTVRITDRWRIETGPGVAAGDVAPDALREDLAARFRLRLQGGDGVIRLEIRPGVVAARPAVAPQAYEITIAPGRIEILANAAPGLFYGVETLVQLAPAFPVGKIRDWPDLELRAIYWDDAHHLDRPEYLKRAIRQAAFYKINAFALKLEGHFQYKSAPAVVEPYAMTPAELQELTDYGLRYHVQVIPYLDGPAHIAFILKHPEYAHLREYPNNNYELCATNPDSYKLLQGMYQDLLDANRGVQYFYLSTDEAYYIGLADNTQCHESARARELGSVGKLLAEFLYKTAGYLHDRGRSVIFWGEYPLKLEDIAALPSYLINGETNGRGIDAAYRARGMRQMIYVSTQGEERMFPDYFILPIERRVHPVARPGTPRIEEAAKKIATDPARQEGDVMGTTVAAWADAGLHTETFWLGYATIAAAAWNASAPPDREAFYRLFYGPSARRMDRVYELMSRQAQFWADSWDTTPSTRTKPILGNSRGIYDHPRPRNDQTLPMPPDAKRVQLARESLRENDELLALLRQRVEFNPYNLEVFRSIAQICRHNLELILGRPTSRDRLLKEVTDVWYKTWYPRVAEANGRRFLHDLDDVKDHLPDRTVDMSYLFYRELRANSR